jgi:hypothetical protein
MAERLIIYNSAYNVSTPSQLLAANLALMEYPDATLKDVAAVTTGDITTYVSTTLVDDTYTDIFICCVTQSAGATGLLSYDQVAMLRPKMITASKGTTVRADTCQANVTVTEIVLDAAASATTNYYRYMFIQTAGVTAVNRYITAYNGTSKVATVSTTSTAITSTETFVVYTNTNIYQLGDTVAATGKTAAYLMWEELYPSADVPLLVNYIGGYKCFDTTGTATAVAAGTITLDATGATAGVSDKLTLAQLIVADSVKDMYVYVYSATTGAGQYRKITASAVTTAVCTLESNWTVTPTGTVVYRVCEGLDKVLVDRAVEIWIKTELYDPSSADAKAYTKLLCDDRSMASATYSGTVSQDLVFLETIKDLGRFAFRADSTLYI